MPQDAPASLQKLRRTPQTLMTPQRLGVLPATRLSFLQCLMRRMIRNRWQIGLTRMEVDRNALGLATYRIDAEDHLFNAIIFSVDHYRGATGRTWETRWDVLVWLIEGELTAEQIEIAARVNPEIVTGGGRTDSRTLSWTRANWSDRSSDHVLERLTEGRQPEIDLIRKVGYLLRNNYYQANGMNGTRMFAAYDNDHPLSGVYASQMFGLYLMREISIDLVEAAARERSDRAAVLAPDLKRYIGVGNSTGIGLNLFVNNHPMLLNRWLEQREHALALAKSQRPFRRAPDVDRLAGWLDRAIRYRSEDLTDYGLLAPSGRQIADDLRCARLLVAEYERAGTIQGVETETPWATLSHVLEGRISTDATEFLHSILVETYPDLVDPIVKHGVVSEVLDVVPHETIGDFRQLLDREYKWACGLDLESAAAQHWIWYRSVEGEEPRLGERAVSGVSPHLDLAFDVPREVQRLTQELDRHPAGTPIARLLLEQPTMRAIIARIQSTAGTHYHTVYANLHHRDISPVHLSRFVLTSLKGQDKVAGYSDRWVRGIFLQGAPTASEVGDGADEDWQYPPKPVNTD
jgi:hypothetical protein